MNIRRELSITFCWLIAIDFCLFALPANAQLRGAVDAAGIVKQTPVKPGAYLLTIDTKRRELLKVIGEGTATGKLTQLQADELRTELDVVTQLELAARLYGDYAVPYVEITVIAERLDVVGQRLNKIYAFPFTPIMTNGRFIVSNGEIVQLDVIAMRRAELEGKISLALAHSTLSRSQVNDLRRRLDDIAVTEVQLRHGDTKGEFTNEQARTLFQAFDRVGSKLDLFIASNKGKPVTGIF